MSFPEATIPGVCPVNGKSRREFSKLPLFVFEALGSLACGFYGNYVFFLFRDRHGFGDQGNLGIAALMGLVIALASWQGGRFAERRGLVRTIRFGLCGMVLALVIGACLRPLPVQLAVLVAWTASQFVMWPALEALVTEGVSGRRRAGLVGIYSVVWAACSALSYFFGGAVFERLGPSSIFWLPPAIHVLQLLILTRVQELPSAPAVLSGEVTGGEDAAAEGPPPDGRSFQRMAWFANPFACVAAFTLLAMIPELAKRMGLSTTIAGLFCSIWFFARLAAFVVMWKWSGWHYRFLWLLVSYLLLITGFAAILTAETLVRLAVGQVAFGLAVGSLYYASLFYSMDVGESRAEQGGIHEAMMGAGNFIGPGVAALTLVLVPDLPNAGVWSVSAILLLGLAVLLGNRLKSRRLDL